jgi:HEAT repeats
MRPISNDDPAMLMQRALAIEDYDADERWEIIRALHARTDRETFDATCALARSDEVPMRVLGLDILSQIGYSADRPYREDTMRVLIDACDDARPLVLGSAITALGHLHDERGLSTVLRYAAHPHEDVRFAAAWALPPVAGDPAEAAAVAALIRLTADSDPDVRDWATFGIGTLLADEDSVAIRDALVARLDDEEGDTAGEALLGLARRRDPRVLPVLLARLDDDPGNLVVEAAAELGAPEALSALERLLRAGWQEDVPRPNVLDDAIRACAAHEAGGGSA